MCVCVCVKEVGRQKERQTDRERERERETDRQTETERQSACRPLHFNTPASKPGAHYMRWSGLCLISQGKLSKLSGARNIYAKLNGSASKVI